MSGGTGSHGDDIVIETDGLRMLIPGALADDVPEIRRVAWGMRADGATWLAFATGEPTVEAIASTGYEVVATFVAAFSPADLRTFHAHLSRRIAELPPD